ncbi:MAG: Chlorite dismutase [Candidatus Parvarchaeum acidophilus ARMAN-5]|jgi:chlorite dismutase|uniref:Chlorite dismutase n=1 Tax=Candidatus Parvarchaeum acidophilus ARMAN-5 TaxID=662762 RepID=D6GUA3_PARA5|nr:MAG: Chlorite dismutase [Candidatus Parvarchaeum acidophilus ARMAN-5]EFD93159.1 MAG: Chlorite dismutase [Candidatus Parvarchaeum acidophilus ARMAN-5]
MTDYPVSVTGIKLKHSWWTTDSAVRHSVMDSLKMEISRAKLENSSINFYSSLRYDTDIIFWMTADSWEKLSAFKVFLSKTFGDYGEFNYGFLSVCQKPFVENKNAKYFIAYPMRKSTEWYLLPENERKQITAEHISMAKSSGNNNNISSYTMKSFGVSDDEFLVLYELPSINEWIRVVEELRQARARKWVTKEIPVLAGIKDEAFLYFQ